VTSAAGGPLRLFVAVVPPPDALAEFAALVGRLREQAPSLRWAAPEQWHLTLTFLAAVEPAVVDELRTRLERAARRHPPGPISLAGGGRFGDRVLWCGIAGDRGGLIRLAAATTAAAVRTNLLVDDRRYRPHLTLARSPGGADLRPLVGACRGFAGRLWRPSEIRLVRSRLGPPTTHEVLDLMPLGGA
jgi:RNA 2',3'-cyclic 3'-phosphodiesterase